MGTPVDGVVVCIPNIFLRHEFVRIVVRLKKSGTGSRLADEPGKAEWVGKRLEPQEA